MGISGIRKGKTVGNVTIKDIAKHAGVSVATVSRVINNQTNVSEKVKGRVQETIKNLNYYPNRAARDLKCQSTKTIAFLIADGTNEYFSQIAQAIINIVKDSGYTLFICNSFNDSKIEKNYLTMLYERNIDGIILNSCGQNNELITQLSQKIPIVLIHRHVDTVRFHGDFVDADFGNTTFEMTTSLIQNNHNKIAIISGPLMLSSANDRWKNFKRAMLTIGVCVDSDYIYFRQGPHDSAFGYSAAADLLSLPKPPTAIVACHNETCIGLLRYCKEHNIDIPNDVSIVSPCNVNLVDLFYVNPTCALPDTWTLGSKIGEMLLERIIAQNDVANREVVFTPKIIEGTSILRI